MSCMSLAGFHHVKQYELVCCLTAENMQITIEDKKPSCC